MNLKEKTYLWPIVILRLYIGSYLLRQGILKYIRHFPQTDWISRELGDVTKASIYSSYELFLIDVVVPHRVLFGYLVTSDESMIGVCLVLGLLTRFVSIIGIFQLLSYYVGPGMSKGGSTLAQQ